MLLFPGWSGMENVNLVEFMTFRLVKRKGQESRSKSSRHTHLGERPQHNRCHDYLQTLLLLFFCCLFIFERGRGGERWGRGQRIGSRPYADSRQPHTGLELTIVT